MTSAVASELPVRRLKLAKAGAASGLTSEEAKSRFCGTSAGLFDGLECLNKAQAIEYRDKRQEWNARKLRGIVIVRDGLKQAFRDDQLTTEPFPGLPLTVSRPVSLNQNVSKVWCEAQTKEFHALGVVWIDHPSPESFDACTRLLNEERGADLNDSQNFRWVSAEGVFHGSPHADLLASLNQRPGGWELIAAALPRVVVLDERVQNEVDSQVRNIPCGLLWRHMGVWVPGKDVVDLNYPTFEGCQTFLRYPAQWTSHLPIDHLVVHLTVLEALQKKYSSKSIPEIVALLVAGTLAADAEISVVTGRGVSTVVSAVSSDTGAATSDQVTRGVRYLPVSALLEYLVVRPSKLGLMRVLWSAARPDG